MADMDSPPPGGSTTYPAFDERRNVYSPGLVVLGGMVALLAILSILSLIVAIGQAREGSIQLYTIGSTSYSWNDDSSLNMSVEICTDSDEPITSAMAQEWQVMDTDAVYPGVFRVFTARPGCAVYPFSYLHLPAGTPVTSSGEPCIAWTVLSYVSAMSLSRPVEHFGMFVGCAGSKE